MSKIKVMVFSNDNNGVGYYRILAPFLTINDENIEIVFVSSDDFTFRFTEEILKDINIMVYSKFIPHLRTQNDLNEFNRLVQKYNIKIVFDIDDFWTIDSTHPNYDKNHTKKEAEITIRNILSSSYITTTTEIFAQEIRKINPNVIVLENAINTKEKQWTPNKIESEKTRFIWGGGVTHEHDLRLLSHSLQMNDIVDNTQLYLCGFDLRARDQKTGQLVIDSPRYNKWVTFEKSLTNNHKSIKNKDYLKYLNEFTDNGENMYGYNETYKNEFYQRRWSKPILVYGTMYNEADVALSPLTNNDFNRCKSQLKVLEAGIHKCPIIASNVGPYTIDIVDGENGFLIDTYSKTGWYDKMKYFTQNKNAIKDMGESLNELILEKYTLEKVNAKRIQFLKELANL